MVALALMVSCMPSAYTISASEAFGDGTEDIFTDGDFTSEPAAEESTPDVSSADQEETKQAQQSTLTYENDSVKVTAEALEDGALPQNTALKADGVNENSSVSYDTVSQKLSAAATDKGSSLRGFFAYDVYFADGDGNRVEPNGRVRVTFEYKTPAAPELTDAASTSVTVEKLHYNSSTGDTDVNTLQANEDLKVLNVNEGKQIQTLQVETGNAAVFAVMWDSPETADVEAEAVSGNEDEVPIASEELTDGMDISDEPEQDAAETPAAENPEVTPDAEPSEAPAENPDAEPTEAPAEDPDVVEEPAEDIASPDEVPAADENGETSLIEVLGDDTNLRVSPSVEAEVLATVNAGTQLTLLDTVTAEDGATWYKVSWEGTEAYIRSDMAQVVDSSDEAEEVEDVQESEEVSYSKTIGDVVVTATAASGVLPEDAQFVVNPIEKDSNQYADVADRLEKKAENEDYSIAGFLAYDIYFQDSEGNKINPEDGKVKVSMEYQNATAPDEVKEADAATMAMASANENSQDDTEMAEQNLSVSVMHFVEDEDGNVTEVVNMSNEGQAEVNTTDNGEIKKAEFETDSFSIFSVVWQSADEFVSAQASSGSFSKLKNTVDNIKDGITLNLFDYDTKLINKGHALEFNTGQGGGFNTWTGDLTSQNDANGNTFSSNRDTAKVTPYQGIMNKQLGKDSDGNYTYPTIKAGNSNESSSYLFSTAEETGKKVYSNVNKLFTKDSDGYYEYNSTTNYAYLNGSNFDVYDIPATCEKARITSGGANTGGFFPFNPLASNSSNLRNGIRNIESGTNSKLVNYHFGMTMSANFLQPENGTVNGKNMKFEFSGDDDVWVYIDGVLVLDIGGIHDAITGSIDFATGTVKVTNKSDTNLKTLFENAGIEDTSIFNEDTFADYTGHTINFYYLERGAGASNCHLKFNLTTMPEGKVAVEKQLSNTDKEKYANVEFKFQLLAQDITSKDDKKETYSDDYVTLGSNAVLNDGTAVGFSNETINGKTYNNVFKLKPGQRATFAGLKKNRKYIVKEIGVESKEYDKVLINKVEVKDQNGNVTSGEATVANRPLVVFTNNCSAANRRELRITKQIKNNIAVKDTFKFKVWLNGQEYTGDYYLKDSKGNYYTINANGKLESHGNSSTVCGTAENGVISSIPAGYTVSITQILSGTTFKVEEEDLSSDYGTPEYKVDETTAIVKENSEVAEGTIELNKDAQVTITNTLASVAELVIKKVNTKGDPLSGAEFTLTSQDDNSKTYTEKSGDDGIIKFENLPLGTYTLTEAVAPDGYVASKEAYKVEVTVSGDKATAKLYKANGKTEVEGNQIVNYTEKEEAEKSLSSNKTAEVDKYNSRTYKIKLHAETTGETEGVAAQGASIVLVMDASGSMRGTALTKIKEAATNFVDTAAGQSSISQISVIWYRGDDDGGKNVTTNSEFINLDSPENIESLKKTINSESADGGTPMGADLEAANERLGSAKHSNKYVIFFTDGMPGYDPYSASYNCRVANRAVDNASKIKEKEKATIYTVRYGNVNDSFRWSRDHSGITSYYNHGYTHKSMSANLFLENYIASTGCAYATNDISGLNGIFEKIAGQVGKLFTTQPQRIVDTIDARFKLTDDGLNALANNCNLGEGKINAKQDGSKEIIWKDETKNSELGRVTIVENKNGTTTITWTGQAALIGNSKDENGGWNTEFQIQAKDDFIGGNMIPTNGADSGIYLDSGDIKKFKQPSVNVKLLSLSINDKEKTLFKGDSINTQNFENELAETIRVVELDNKTKTLTAVTPQEQNLVKLPVLTHQQIETLSTEKSLTIGGDKSYEYTYPGSNEAVGYFTYTYTLAKGDNADNHVATAVGNEVEKYKLTVTYHPYSKSDRSTILSGTGVQQPDAEKGGTPVNSNLEATGNYVVNVVAGNIQIIKELDGAAEQDETFKFTITDENNRTVATATATIKKDELEATAVFTLAEGVNAKLESNNTKLIELSRGDYKVVESLGADVHYELQEIATVDRTNCHSVIARDQQQKATDITFTMGTDTGNNEVLKNGNTDKINGQIGIAKFTNKKTVVNINLEKVDSQTADTKLSGAKFDLYKVDANGKKTDQAIHSYTSGQHGAISIENLPMGQYVLIETEAPAGYMVSAKPWNIVVANNRTVTVTYNGKDVKTRQDNDTIYYQITNAKVYSLPQSGGPGTYGFTISGVAILATALLLFINNKRREEEAKRS